MYRRRASDKAAGLKYPAIEFICFQVTFNN